MSSPSGQQAPTTWTEPPWCGWIETTGDALLILEAARRGLIPRVTRRLVDSERKMITSGSVFVFDEDESGIKRWTDGFFWSPSRILGNFLLYRETDKKTSGRGRGNNEMDVGDDGNSLSRPRESAQIGTEKLRERNLMGSLTNNYKFKSDGLMKKTFSLSIGGVAQHLISYYRVEDVENGRLRSPSSLPELASLSISPEYLDKTHFRNPPKVEMGPDGIPRYRGEADDVEIGTTRSPTLPAPFTSNPPLLGDPRVETPGPKRSKRYDPYGQPASKRPRKQKSGSQGEDSPTATSPSSTEQLTSPTQSTTPPLQSPTAQTFPDSAAPHPPVYGYYPQHMYHPYPHPSSPVPVSQQPSTSASSTTYPPSGSVVPYSYDPNTSANQQQQFVYSYYPAPPNFWQYQYPQPQPGPSISAPQQQSPSSPVRAGSGGGGHTPAEKSQDDAAAAGGAHG